MMTLGFRCTHEDAQKQMNADECIKSGGVYVGFRGRVVRVVVVVVVVGGGVGVGVGGWWGWGENWCVDVISGVGMGLGAVRVW